VREYASHFCEAALESYDLQMRFPPSKIAATCLYYARHCSQLSYVWDSSMEEYIGYKVSDLRGCIQQFERDFGPLIQYILDNFRES
jgi:hypothetical protein